MQFFQPQSLILRLMWAAICFGFLEATNEHLSRRGHEQLRTLLNSFARAIMSNWPEQSPTGNGNEREINWWLITAGFFRFKPRLSVVKMATSHPSEQKIEFIEIKTRFIESAK